MHSLVTTRIPLKQIFDSVHRVHRYDCWFCYYLQLFNVIRGKSCVGLQLAGMFGFTSCQHVIVVSFA